MGQLVRFGVIVVMGALTYWKVGAAATAVLAVEAIAQGALAFVAFR